MVSGTFCCDCISFNPRPLGRDTLRLTVFTGTPVGSCVFWLGGSLLRLPDVYAGETHHSRLVDQTGVLELQRTVHQCSNLRRGRLLRGTWGTPLNENANGAQGILETSRRVWATVLRLVPKIRRPYAKLVSMEGDWQIPVKHWWQARLNLHAPYVINDIIIIWI